VKVTSFIVAPICTNMTKFDQEGHTGKCRDLSIPWTMIYSASNWS